MGDPFFMVSLEVYADRLMALGRRRGLPLRETDNGYLVHTALGELFGGLAPKPFAIQESRGRRLRLLGYSQGAHDALREHADALADPAVHNSCDWASLATKQMPLEWVTGKQFGFRVRACPVVRRSGAGPHGERPGREMDAFLAQLEKDPETQLRRDDVYTDWLRAAFDRSAGAKIETAQMTSFSLQRLIRRDKARKPRPIPARKDTVQGGAGRPDVTLTGVIRVVDSERFADLLRRGVGRHRAFGFGMILLRPIA